jgi:pyruvate dehydrogenase E2 component (dihydrolipoamide acetyltransferase)
MAEEVRMPALGQTTDQLLITSWIKAEGDMVRLGEPLCEVETDKATIEVESFVAGTLLRILHKAGETVEVGTPIAYIGVKGEQVPASGGSELAAAASPAAPVPNVAASDLQDTEKIVASPVARQLAKSHGIDLSTIRGSGPRGRIDKEDVQALVAAMAAPRGAAVLPDSTPNAAPALPDGEPQAVPPGADGAQQGVSGLGTGTLVPRHRQVIAQRLTRSVQTIPHITLCVSIDMRRAREALASGRDAGLEHLSYTHLILRAIARALQSHPAVNRVWSADGGGPRYRPIGAANVGLAVAGDDTLLVTTICNADSSSLAELVRSTDEAVRRARSSSLNAADTRPAAIILSNLGMYRVDAFQAIIDPDQSAILATGQIVDQVVAVDGGIHVRPQLRATLSIDHRVADGVQAAKFLEAIAGELEQC